MTDSVKMSRSKEKNLKNLDDPNPDHRLSLDSIVDAVTMIDPVFLNTPQYECEPLSEALGCRLTLKVETTNPIRSFKGRGTDYFLTTIGKRGDTRDLVCASTGNFGQAMAYACRNHGRRLIVYADEGANQLKLDRASVMGAEVRLEGSDFDDAKSAAKRHCEETGAWMIEDGREPEISEGAGTIAFELMTSETMYDLVTIPVGNGALITGMARWMKAAAPGTRIVGVSATGADSMAVSWRNNQVIENERVDTIAEGIAVRVPVPEAVDDMQTIVDQMVLVDDDLLIAAMQLIYRTTGLLVEPAGAAGVAAVMNQPDRYVNKLVATVLTGSNITPDQASRWLGIASASLVEG